MFNVGGGELLVIALIALIVLGPSRLPEAARTVGKVVGEIRRLSTGFQREIRDALEDADTDRRLPERAPLAAAVDDADAAGEAGARRDRAGTGTAAAADATDLHGPDRGADTGRDPGTLAPEVGDALDQVVGATGPADDAAPDTADVPEDGPGDARAAS